MEPAVKTTWNDPMPGIEAATRNAMLEILVNTVAEAKELCPVEHGMLVNSLMWQMEGEEGGFNEGGKGKEQADSSLKLNEPRGKLVGYVGTNVHYGIYQEAGTRWVIPHPFLRPAVALKAQGVAKTEIMRKWAAIRTQYKALKKATEGGKGPVKLGDIKESF